MESGKKQNIAVIGAFLVPIVFLAIVAGAIYLPSATLSTDYDFVYATCDGFDRYYNDRYCDQYMRKAVQVQDSRIVEKDVKSTQDSDRDGVMDVDEGYKIRIYLHDTSENSSREISMADAQRLTVNDLTTSPDGVTVSYHRESGVDVFPIIDSGSSYGYYMMKGDKKQKVDLITNNRRYYYDSNFYFLGWIPQ